MSTTRLLVISCLAALLASSCGTSNEASTTTETTPNPTPTTTTEEDKHDDHSDISSPQSEEIDPQFDLITTKVTIEGNNVVFTSSVVQQAGTSKPEAVGDLDQAPVWSYVWPTSLNSKVVGFEADQGILALAATSHPDFDDTPLYDENGDNDPNNDGADWHAHWVVLTPSEDCSGDLAVKDIPEGETPTLPDTWPELPILIDSPDYKPEFDQDSIRLRIPTSQIGTTSFNFDGVTAGLRVSTSPHDPLLCVENVFDVASGDLSLPGTIKQ